MSSSYKRAHRTHALAQPAGKPYPHLDQEQVPGRAGADRQVLDLFSELCVRVPDAAQRAKLLEVSAEIEAAWSRGVALPVLRAHRRTLERTLRDLAAH